MDNHVNRVARLGAAVLIKGTWYELFTLADRIAVNREIAGFHYPSDSVAGRFIAEEAYKILKNCPTFMQAVADAQKEWADRA